jgi:transposase
VVEGLGQLSRWRLTDGQVHDIAQAAGLLDGLPAQAVLADKAYDADDLLERFFCRIKQFRWIATRHEKLALRYSAFVALTASFIWLD